MSKLTVRSLDDNRDGVLLKHRSGVYVCVCVRAAVFKYESVWCVKRPSLSLSLSLSLSHTHTHRL